MATSARPAPTASRWSSCSRPRDLVGRHAAARIELRITPSIWPFWRRVADSTVEFSGMRLGNSGPDPDRFG